MVWRAGSPLGGSSQLTVLLARTNVALVILRAVSLARRLRNSQRTVMNNAG
ncbi:hypothetical protein [Nitrospira sp. Nam80]